MHISLVETMQSSLVIIAIFLPSFCLATCSIGQDSDPQGPAKANDGINDHDSCTNAIRGHVKMEFEAALQYMMMGIHFAQDTVNLPGFSNMFFASASEERQHGIKFIDYLKMRGDAEMDLGINDLAPILGKQR